MNLSTIIVLILIAVAIAYFLGTKRHTGFGWSLFFGIFLSPLVELIVILLTPKLDKDIPPSKDKNTWGIILIVFFGLSAIARIIMLSSDPYSTASAIGTAISIGIGFVGLGIYLIDLSKGKNATQSNFSNQSTSATYNSGINYNNNFQNSNIGGSYTGGYNGGHNNPNNNLGYGNNQYDNNTEYQSGELYK